MRRAHHCLLALRGLAAVAKQHCAQKKIEAAYQSHLEVQHYVASISISSEMMRDRMSEILSNTIVAGESL